MSLDPQETIQRFRRLDELYELTVAMRREALRRQFPAESDEAIEGRLRDWLLGPKGQQPDPRAKSPRQSRSAPGELHGSCADVGVAAEDTEADT